MLRPLLAALVLALSPLAPAHACTCGPTDVARSWRTSDHAFVGTVVRKQRSGSYDVVRFRVLQTGKSCLPEGGYVEVGTPTSSAACGQSFQVGRSYLVFAHDQVLGGRTRRITTLCDGDKLASAITADEMAFLSTRPLACPSPGLCADGTDPVACFVEPCAVAAACGEPDAFCEDNFCNGCTAEWYTPDDRAACVPW